MEVFKVDSEVILELARLIDPEIRRTDITDLKRAGTDSYKGSYERLKNFKDLLEERDERFLYKIATHYLYNAIKKFFEHPN